jgi:hypothetical protein
MIRLIQYCKCSKGHEFISSDSHPECQICKESAVNHMVVVCREEYIKDEEIQ